MTMRDFLKWWGGQLRSLAAEAIPGGGADPARSIVLELQQPSDATTAMIALTLPRRRSRPATRQVLPMTDVGLAQLRAALQAAREPVRLHLPAGMSNTYVYDIPRNMPQGAYWYHSHLHTLTGPQTYSGLAGLLAIGRTDGNLPVVTEKKIPIRNMVLQYNAV